MKNTKPPLNKCHLKEVVQIEIQKLSGLSRHQIEDPRGKEARLVRRVLAWAYIQVIGESLPKVAQDLQIAHRCSVNRILRKKTLSADEYDLRKRLLHRISSYPMDSI
jgi:hypothetical protein